MRDKLVFEEFSYVNWALFMGGADKHVGDDDVDGIRISTVFLGFDSSIFGDGDPLLFETMVFINKQIGHMARYFTWAEAEAGHAQVVTLVKEQQAVAQQIGVDALCDLMAKSKGL